MDLVEFLRARLDEDEAAAMAARDHSGPGVFERDNYGYLLVQTTRVLADVEAKRRIVEMHQPLAVQRMEAEPYLFCSTCGSGEPHEYPTDWPCSTLLALALPYVDHADYDEAWNPDLC